MFRVKFGMVEANISLQKDNVVDSDDDENQNHLVNSMTMLDIDELLHTDDPISKGYRTDKKHLRQRYAIENLFIKIHSIFRLAKSPRRRSSHLSRCEC